MTDLPSLDQPLAWVVVHGNEQAGPYTLDLLISEVVAGRLSEATPVWWPPLPDWTTISANPMLVAEIGQRRGAAAPGWAPQPHDRYQPGPNVASQPVGDQSVGDPTAAGANGFAHGAVVEDASPEVTYLEDPAADVDGVSGSDEAVADEFDDAVVLDPGHPLGTSKEFAALVARSRRLFERSAALTAVDRELARAVTDASARFGYGLVEATEVGESNEYRLTEPTSGNVLVVSLGRVSTTSPESLLVSVVPLSVGVTTRSFGGGSLRSEVTGEHGQVVVRPDEWNGQTSGTVSLLIGVRDYVDDELAVDRESLERDLCVVIEAVNSALSS